MVRLNGVTKSYAAKTAVQALSLQVARGEYVAIVGPSGCGKTTALRIIAGLEDPDFGEVWLQGKLANSPALLIPPYKRGVGMVFQSLALWPHMTVEQHLAYVVGKVRPRRSVLGEIDQLLDRGKLTSKRQSYPGEMSGGEQQRLALLRAVAVSPSLLLLDEPMSSLDRHARGELADEIKNLRASADLTVLHVTHDWRDVRGLADRVIEIEDGAFRRQSSAANYFQERIAEEIVL